MQYQTAAVMQCQTSLILIMNKVFNQKSALFGQLPSSVVSTTSKTNFPTYLFNRIRIALRTVQCIHNTLLYSSLVRQENIFSVHKYQSLCSNLLCPYFIPFPIACVRISGLRNGFNYVTGNKRFLNCHTKHNNSNIFKPKTFPTQSPTP